MRPRHRPRLPRRAPRAPSRNPTRGGAPRPHDTTNVVWRRPGAAADHVPMRIGITLAVAAAARPRPAEHGGSGTWQIIDGTGPLANLHGKGTFTSSLVSGHSDDPPTIVFRSTWNGVADFDAQPPTVVLKAAVVRKLERSV